MAGFCSKRVSPKVVSNAVGSVLCYFWFQLGALVWPLYSFSSSMRGFGQGHCGHWADSLSMCTGCAGWGHSSGPGGYRTYSSGGAVPTVCLLQQAESRVCSTHSRGPGPVRPHRPHGQGAPPPNQGGWNKVMYLRCHGMKQSLRAALGGALQWPGGCSAPCMVAGAGYPSGTTCTPQ